MLNRTPIDSLIFDMDGTLWDAVDSYADIWNITLDQQGIPHNLVTRDDLLSLMGSYLDDIIASLLPGKKERKELLERVMKNEAEMMPSLGGILYPGVKELIPRLAQKYRLFMVSNCGDKGLENFVRYNGFENCFVDLLSHGSTGKSKTENIRDLIERHNLKSPAYIGDTQSDADSTHAADIPFVWARYGFGDVKTYEAAIDSFSDITAAVETLDRKIAEQK